MTLHSGGDVRQRRSRLFDIRLSRSAFTLVETLVALLIVALMSGTLALAGAASSEPGNPQKEAYRLSRWLSKTIVAANRSGRAFALHCSGSSAREYVEIRWSNGTKDRYTAAYECRFIRRGIGSESLWSAQWHTLTPALTLRVTNGRSADDHFVVVSAHGRVRTASFPP